MNALWLGLLTINIFFFSISTILQRVLLKESQSKPIAYAIAFQFLSGIMVVILGFLFGSMKLPSLLPLLFNLILGVLLYAFANLFIFKSLKQTEVSKFTIIFATRLGFTILASSLLLQEFLNGKQIIGALLLFVGIAIVSLKKEKFVFTKGDVYAVIAAVCFGFANSNARYLLKDFQVFPYLSYVFITPAIFLALLYPKEVQSSIIFVKGKNLMKLLVLCFIWSIANLAFFAALKIGNNSSQTTAVGLFSVIVTVLLSIIFLHEKKQMWKKILGSIVSFVGIILLIL